MKLFLIIASTLLLQSCFFVVGAAAGAAAIAVVYDHRTIESTLNDTKLATNVTDRIKKIPDLYNQSHIEVTVFNNVVLLTGETPNANWRNVAGEAAQSTPEVSKVYNQIRVEGPTSSLARTNDTWITTKIRSQMLANTDLKSGNIKVVTEHGTVYLMGIVSKQQAEIAVDIAKEVSGVQQVIKIFQYNS